jgi:hypothetical protein
MLLCPEVPTVDNRKEKFFLGDLQHNHWNIKSRISIVMTLIVKTTDLFFI